MTFHQVARHRSIQQLLRGLEAQFGRDIPVSAALAPMGPVSHRQRAQNLWESTYASCRRRGLPVHAALEMADLGAFNEGYYGWRPDLRDISQDYRY